MTSETATTKFGTAAFVLIAGIPVFATVLFGGVDTGTWGILVPLVAAIVVCWIAHSYASRTFSISCNSLQIPLIVLLTVGLIQLMPISATRSLDPYNTRLFLIRLVCYLAFFAAALVLVNTERRVKVIAYGTVIFGAIMAFAATLQRLASPDAIYGFREPLQAVPFGPFVNQHHFAGFMEMTGALTTAFLFSEAIRREKKLLLGLAAIIMALACVLTSSRGGLACFIAGIVFVAIMIRTGARSDTEAGVVSYKKTGIALGLFAVIVVALVVFVGGDQSLLRGVGLQQSTADISNGRSHFWTIALNIFAAHPFLGAGLDAFGVAFSKHDTWNGTFRVEQAHNEYLQLMAEAGLLGLISVVGFVLLLVKRGMGNIRKTSDPFLRTCAIGAMGGCIAIALHSLVDFPLRTPSNAFFFLLLAVVATGTSQLRKNSA